MTNTAEKKKLVEVKHLKQYFGTKNNLVKAIDDISFDIYIDTSRNRRARLLGSSPNIFLHR